MATRMLFVLVALAAIAYARRPNGMNHGLENFMKHNGLQSLNDEPVEVRWFQQRVDHFNPQDTRTFSQQYQVNMNYHQPGGPLFVLLGGEGPASTSWLSNPTAIMTYAKHFNAAVVQLEHRFYGKTQPFGNLKTENLRYLSSRQAIADAADFILAFKQMNNLEDAKVVSFGGSYSGALSAFLRTKFPHIVDAAVATSGPVEAKLDYVEYQEVVGRSLATSTHGQACVDTIRQGHANATAMLYDSKQQAQVIADFRSCSGFKPQSDDDFVNFLDTLAGNIDGIVQYNLDEFHGKNPTIQSMCDVVDANKEDAYKAYVALQSYLLNATGQACVDMSYTNFISSLRNTSVDADGAAMRSWVYQTCTEFAYFQSFDANDQPFGRSVNVSFFEEQCVLGFGLPAVPDVNATNAYYGGKKVQGTRIIYPNGSIDPWHALGITTSMGVADTEIIYINGTAHCANMYPSLDTDLPSLTAARAKIQTTLEGWIA